VIVGRVLNEVLVVRMRGVERTCWCASSIRPNRVRRKYARLRGVAALQYSAEPQPDHPCTGRYEAEHVRRDAGAAGVAAGCRHRRVLAVLASGLSDTSRPDLLHAMKRSPPMLALLVAFPIKATVPSPWASVLAPDLLRWQCRELSSSDRDTTARGHPPFAQRFGVGVRGNLPGDATPAGLRSCPSGAALPVSTRAS